MTTACSKRKACQVEEFFSLLKDEGIVIKEEGMTVEEHDMKVAEEVKPTQLPIPAPPSPPSDDGQKYYNIGVDYYKKEKYCNVLQWFLKAESQGHSDAQNMLGIMHQHAIGLPRNYKKARNLYRAASKKDGNMRAQNNMAGIYLKGLGVSKDVHKAIHWYLKAVNQGSSYAETSLGRIYYNDGKVKNLQKAANWYQRAFNHGDKNVEPILKDLYKQGYYPEEEYQEIEITTMTEEQEESEEEDEDDDDDDYEDDKEEQIKHVPKRKRTHRSQRDIFKFKTVPPESPPKTPKVKGRLTAVEEKLESFQVKLEFLQKQNAIFKLQMEIKDKEIKNLKESLAKR